MSTPYITANMGPIITDAQGNRYLNTAKTETVYANNADELSAIISNQAGAEVSNVQEVTQSTDQSKVEDEDDGKVGFFSGLCSIVKGAVKGIANGIKGMFTDENGKFSLWKTIKSAATVAACFIPGVGPFISAGLCAYGVIKGGTGVVKGISAAANAKTDAEKHAALESIGANGATAVASAYGLKGSVGAIAKNMGGASGATFGQNLSTIKNGLTSGKGVTGKFNNLTGGYYQNSWQTATAGKTGVGRYVSGAKAVGKQMVVDGGKNVISTGHSLVQYGKGKFNGIKGRLRAKQTTNGTAPQQTGYVTRAKNYVHNKAHNVKEYVGQKTSGAKDYINGKVNNAKTNFAAKHPKATGKYQAVKNGYKAYKTIANDYYTNAKTANVYGAPRIRTAFTAGLSPSMANASDQMLNQIPNSNVSYVTADVASGGQVQLQNYDLLYT